MAKQFFAESYKDAALVYGMSFPDGLSGESDQGYHGTDGRRDRSLRRVAHDGPAHTPTKNRPQSG
ncbi:MAG: hypothetical protein II035_07680 [Firmicutes bacterium]|nr:hypothetical protein [Bacillota bacterium]MBQ1716209.1 hypothetical protein [Bacillota bacterium]MBQ1825086.1 hypothetical protein [Bacillota bacterium]